MNNICDDDLLDEIRFLEKDINEFKNGDTAYYKRIALTVRKLIHDTSNSTSLLTHLNIKNKLPFLVQGSKRIFYTEQNGRMQQERSSICPLSDPQINQITNKKFSNLPQDYTLPNHMLPHQYYGLKCTFEQWWDASSEINCMDKHPNTKLYAYYDTDKKFWTRRDLILNAVHTDGGAHYDDKVKQCYVNLKKGITSGFLHNSVPVKSLQSSIVEIGHELLHSLKTYYRL